MERRWAKRGTKEVPGGKTTSCAPNSQKTPKSTFSPEKKNPDSWYRWHKACVFSSLEAAGAAVPAMRRKCVGGYPGLM
eukprot:3824375-Rhodomonas_salina.1